MHGFVFEISTEEELWLFDGDITEGSPSANSSVARIRVWKPESTTLYIFVWALLSLDQSILSLFSLQRYMIITPAVILHITLGLS